MKVVNKMTRVYIMTNLLENPKLHEVFAVLKGTSLKTRARATL